MLRFTFCAVGAALMSFLLTSTAWAQDSYVVDTATTETNGDDTRDLDGDDSITVTEDGSIVVGDYGLRAKGDNNTLTNNGVISTNGLNHFGIYINADGVGASGNIVINNGTISTTGRFGEGIYIRELVTTSGNTLINNGTIETTGDDAEGMSSDGGNSILTNTGTIATLGAKANAMSALEFDGGPDNEFNTLTNSGIITTGADSAYGLTADGKNNTLTNSGTITTGGVRAHALYVFGDENTLVNSGSITSNGVAANGFEAVGIENTLINSGTVTTTKDNASGLFAAGGRNTLINSGTVTTDGTNAYGLTVTIGDNTLTNSGTVTTNGPIAFGVIMGGDNNTLTNSGTILSLQSNSVYMGGANETLNLLEGSVLFGDVYFPDPTTATLNFGLGLNAVVRTDFRSVPMTEKVLSATITAPNDQYVVDGDTVYVFDSGFVGASEQAIGGVTSLMLDTLGQQMSHGSMVPSVTQGVVGTQREGWGQVFGTERSADGSLGDSTTAGFMVGADIDDVRGLFFGVARSTQEVDASNDLESDNLFAGYYANYVLNSFDVDASLTFGMATNSSERSVANNTVVGGLETATAEYNSYFLMPAATFSSDIPVASGSLTPSVRVSYAAIHDQAYTETGSAANLDVDSRTSHLFGTRVQLDRGLRGYATGSGMLLVNLRAGVGGQYAKGGDVTATLLGQSFDLEASSDETSGRGFAGIDVRHVSDNEDLELYGSMEVGRSSNDVTDVRLNIGAVFWF